MLREMLERAGRLNRQFFYAGEAHARRPSWEPPIHLFETATAVHVRVALPGVARERIQVLVEDGRHP